tara:strand:- start:1857 stop:2921 length:1065 start_codon:yes stop_codon:yes gene_type:complete
MSQELQNLFPQSIRTVLVTGGAGFIGGTLIKRLLSEKNLKVFNLDKLGYASNLKCIDNILSNNVIAQSNYQFLKADLKNYQEILDIIQIVKPDLIFHLAAESHVDRSIQTPRIFIESNIIGTFNLLEASKIYWESIDNNRKEVFRLHHVSTDEVYGSLGSEGYFSEESAYDPRSPYSASKASSDHLVKAWHHTFGLPIILTNCGNNYGPWQFPEKLIPLAITKAISNQPIPLYGNGLNIRDWIFVDDHVDALLSTVTKGKIGTSYCIGASEQMTNLNVVQDICNLLDQYLPKSSPYSNLITLVEDRLGHDQRYAIDSTRLTKDTGWKPRNSFKKGLEKTVKWFIENQDWFNKKV